MKRKSHGSGAFQPEDFAILGTGCVFERGVLVFHPENIKIGDDVYVGHTILKGYHYNKMEIGDETWIGQQCFFHSAGGITIGKAVGIGPAVKILTSQHKNAAADVPVLHAPVEMAPVIIEDGADIGIGAILLPGVTIGKGSIVGAGAVVTKSVPDFTVVVGSPARILRKIEAAA